MKIDLHGSVLRHIEADVLKLHAGDTVGDALTGVVPMRALLGYLHAEDRNY